MSKLDKKDTMQVKTQEMIDEHKNLVDVLESPSDKDDLKEAKKQKKELKEYKKIAEKCMKHQKSTPCELCQPSETDMKKSIDDIINKVLAKGGPGSGRPKDRDIALPHTTGMSVFDEMTAEDKRFLKEKAREAADREEKKAIERLRQKRKKERKEKKEKHKEKKETPEERMSRVSRDFGKSNKENTMSKTLDQEIEELGDRVEKSTVDHKSELTNTIKELGVEGLKKAMGSLSDEQRSLLSDVIKNLIQEKTEKAVSFDKEAQVDRHFARIEDMGTEQETGSDDEDEDLVKPEAAQHSHQGDQTPEGRDEHVIKAKDELAKKRGVPEGVDPAKHERCVLDLKEKGHDKESAIRICSDSLRGKTKKACEDVSKAKSPQEKLIEMEEKEHGTKDPKKLLEAEKKEKEMEKKYYKSEKDPETKRGRQPQEEGDIEEEHKSKMKKTYSKDKKIAKCDCDKEGPKDPMKYKYTETWTEDELKEAKKDKMKKMKKSIEDAYTEAGLSYNDEIIKGEMKKRLLKEESQVEIAKQDRKGKKDRSKDESVPEIEVAKDASETADEAVKKVKKSIEWPEENALLKAKTLGRNYHCSVNDFYDEVLEKAKEEEVTDENFSELLTKSVKEGKDLTIEDLIEKSMDTSPCKALEQQLIKSQKKGDYSESSFSEEDLFKSLNLDAETAKKILNEE